MSSYIALCLLAQ